MNGHDLGELNVITGPMFAGKSEDLARRLRRENIAHETIVLFRPERDTRYSVAELVTHDGTKLNVPTFVIPLDESCRDIILEKSRNARIIAFDEVQFWNSGVLPEFLRDLAEKQNKIIYATLLNLDFTGRPFENAGNLLSYANDITLLTAVCEKCGSGNAIYSQRLDGNGKALLEGETIKVGGKEDYSARCGKCFERSTSTIPLRQENATRVGRIMLPGLDGRNAVLLSRSF
jgi:thymidine kinase